MTIAEISEQDIARAREAGLGVVKHTPVTASAALSELSGGDIVLKAENMQRTGSFKIRGAMSKLSSLGSLHSSVLANSRVPYAMAGASLADFRAHLNGMRIDQTAVKAPVFPFSRFPGVDPLLGPEMKSTGEVMGIDSDPGIAYAKSQMSAQPPLPLKGNVFISVKDSDKAAALEVARDLVALGYEVHASSGTAKYFAEGGLNVPVLLKIREGRPNVVDAIKNGSVHFIVNTPSGRAPREDEIAIRSAAVAARVSTMTTLRGARASVGAMRAVLKSGYQVKSIQEYHA